MGNIFEAIMEHNYMTDLETIKRIEQQKNLILRKNNTNEKPRKLHRSKRQIERFSERPQK
tara:strand:+ start:5465 stop:5644 length:180 start_codon:yes stop_codon:yes gene_type:complete